MTVSKKSNIKTKINNKRSLAPDGKRSQYKDIWLCTALGVLALLGTWVFVARLGGLGYLTASGLFAWAVEPTTLSVLIAIFGILFIYKSLMHHKISSIAKVVAYIVVATVILTLAFIAILSGQCSPVTDNCAGDFLFRLVAFHYAYFFIPIFLVILTLIGTIALLVDRDGESSVR